MVRKQKIWIQSHSIVQPQEVSHRVDVTAQIRDHSHIPSQLEALISATIFTNGSIYLSGTLQKRLSIAVIDGEIRAVGSLKEAREIVGSSYEEIDLQNGLLSPGFIDAHIHPTMGGLEQSQCNLAPARDSDECLELIRSFADRSPELSWITGGGWIMDHFPGGTPTRQMLDQVIPDRPAMLQSTDRHSVWVNSAALRIARLTELTEDPSDGRIEREPNGYPAGTLHEGAMRLVNEVADKPTLESRYHGLLVGQKVCHSHGITGWQDALLSIDSMGVDSLDVYLHALRSNALQAKVSGALRWDHLRGLEQIDELIERRERAQEYSPKFEANTVKIMLDGIAESFTASLTTPYRDRCGHASENSGLTFISKDELSEIVHQLDLNHFQVHFHALGDQAVRDALDALDDLHSPERGRHQLAHLQFVQETDISRFARLGAFANLQALWAQKDPAIRDLTLPFIDEGLKRRLYPFRELADSNAELSAGSDWPVSSVNPLEAMHVAVNRSSSETEIYGPLLPEQAIGLGTIWDAYTRGSARAIHRDSYTGRIQVGFSADFAVLDRDPFTGPEADIDKTKVTSTWVDGELVWSSED